MEKKTESNFEFKHAIQEDDVFLLDLLHSPIKTLRDRNIICDQQMINNFEKVRNDVIKRAKASFIEIGLVRDSTQGCQGCQGCSAEFNVEA